MRTIIQIQHVEQFTSKDGRKLWRTYALLDTGEEAIGFGKDFDIKDKVEVFFDERWNQIKMRHPK